MEYDLAGKIIGRAMSVHKTLGPGFLETVYHKALVHEITQSNLKVETEKPIAIIYEGVCVGDFIADLVVNNELIVEIKAVQALAKAHEAQLVNYLTATGIETGLLLNFGSQSLEFKKKFRTPKPKVAQF